MTRIRIFRYLAAIDAFDVTPEHAAIADDLGLFEWTPVVWIGRLFCMDNDVGEHWFDNWDAREDRRAAAEQLGLDVDRLLVLDPERFQNGWDGPCNSSELRAAFWKEVLQGLELSTDRLFWKARDMNAKIDARLPDDPALAERFIPDLEERIERWKRRYGSQPTKPGS